MTICKKVHHVLPSLPLRCFLTFLATQGKPLCQGFTLLIFIMILISTFLILLFVMLRVTKLLAWTPLEICPKVLASERENLCLIILCVFQFCVFNKSVLIHFCKVLRMKNILVLFFYNKYDRMMKGQYQSKKSPRSHSRPYYTPDSHKLMHTDDVSASKEGAHDTYDF